ncbi:mitochondrial import receptor subunit TOM20-like [Tripterygium wilfordii]|uniref:mitochondrial import receptor subunit TOM20-like n=1 Tax=Tripterygium wilfordii TaxID=458696 RepID=UPI0018F8560A|nr:mitochondrial import receptor subunit TOM20-like [Tripterygium wilfordii]XP_038704310.1 mitochondrial import receptor subunit TOM20-like [Tripterygium wilfordii]
MASDGKTSPNDLLLIPLIKEEEDRLIKEDRVSLYSNLCIAAETRYRKKPGAKSLSKWGMALMDLASSMYSVESQQLLYGDAIRKLKEALSLNPELPHTHWLLGVAYYNYGILTKDYGHAHPYFQCVKHCFSEAVAGDLAYEPYYRWMSKARMSQDFHKASQEFRLKIIANRKLRLGLDIMPDSGIEEMEKGDKFGCLAIAGCCFGIWAAFKNLIF